ncbi:putative mitochondrial protein [Dendrobium catenatum]|uniref:Putative mitochondrial protein n=1 Tax=Dendrobium catenatum TaxID=906689 RepID=A0A2I0XHE4_9ASPA|nr:putative mitochondrial protein [Dendrobium catenatum]
MNKSWKETLIVLILKVSNPSTPSNYRPINLCNTIYKIAAKVFVNMMYSIIPKLISKEQAVFILGRSLYDHALLAQDIFHKFRYSKSCKGLVSFKIDMEKAYDSMDWQTLNKVLNTCGFPTCFSNLIMECICDPCFTLLINGNQTTRIEARRGFRQGCPLSPFLYFLCSQLLSNVLKRTDNIGIQVSSHGPKISHLLYADDI